jgi:hypothetical protein
MFFELDFESGFPSGTIASGFITSGSFCYFFVLVTLMIMVLLLTLVSLKQMVIILLIIEKKQQSIFALPIKNTAFFSGSATAEEPMMPVCWLQ